MIRVALIGMRPKLRDILSDAVAREKDMRLVQHHAGPIAEAAAAHADVFVCEVEDPDDAAMPTRLLNVVPRARVLMIAETGDRAALFELRPTRQRLLNVSMAQVIDAIRCGLAQGER